MPSPQPRLLLKWLSQSQPCCDLPVACPPRLFAAWQDRPATEPFASESDPPCSASVHHLPDLHELRLHIRQLSWRRDRHLCGFLVCVFATSETDWLSSTFCASVVEISSVLLATVCVQTRIVHETCWAGSHMWTGLIAVRDLQLGSCCQREMLWCGSPLWIVHWWSRPVLSRASRLNFLL